jgi:hypothetical protein
MRKKSNLFPPRNLLKGEVRPILLTSRKGERLEVHIPSRKQLEIR